MTEHEIRTDDQGRVTQGTRIDLLKSIESGVDFATLATAELAVLSAMLFVETKEADEALKNRKRLLDAVDARLAERWQNESVEKTTIALEDGASVTLFVQDKTYVSCPADAKPALIEWLGANGQGGIVKLDVNAATLQAHVKDLIKEGGEVPPMVATTFTKEIGHRRS